MLEHGSPTAPEDDDPEDCAPEILSQYSHGEAQDLYQVTPDTLQQYGCPEPLHAYVSEHSLGMPKPFALGASQLYMMPVVCPSWQEPPLPPPPPPLLLLLLLLLL